MATLKLKAEPREITGRKVEALRREEILPANIYGKGVDSVSIKLPLKDFENIYSEAGETTLIEIDLGKDKKTVLISDLQLDPVTDQILHADFKEVNLNEKVTATVPVELEGESPAEAQSLGALVQQIHELDVEALPLDLPESLQADISSLEELNSAIYVKDLKVDRTKVDIQAEDDLIVAMIQEVKEEVIEAPVVEEGAEEGAEEESAEQEGDAEASKETAEESKDSE